MWTISGPFDIEITAETIHEKVKLLKSGQKYLIGRKDRDLVVNHKKVSRDHGQIIVGGCTAEDVGDPDKIPVLQMLNSKSKAMTILRAGERLLFNPGALEDLQDGDVVDIVTGLPLSFRWHRICCFESASKGRDPVSIDGCASLGINLVRTLHPTVTHHLTPNYNLSPTLSTSLLTASQCVKPDWLREIVRLGVLPKDDPKSLEFTFALPSETKYRPAFSAVLPPALKTFKTWEPNEERLNMFRDSRFIFVGEKGLEIPSDYETLVTRGQGGCETFYVNAGSLKWTKTLSKAKAWADQNHGKVVLVADTKAMEASAKEKWQELVDEAKDTGLQFVLPDNIIQAVAHVDKFYIDCAIPVDVRNQDDRQSSPLPDFVPNTHPDEPTIPPDYGMDPLPNKKRTRRAPSATPDLAMESDQPSDSAPAESSRPLRKFTKRTTQTAMALLGFGDDISMLDASSAAIPEPAPRAVPQPPAAPISQGRPSRFRSRAATVPKNVANLLGLDDDLEDIVKGPGLDKYKALFEASDPDKLGTASSQTQADTQTHGARSGAMGGAVGALAAVLEEEESSASRTQTQASMGGETQSQFRGQKRKAIDFAEHDDVATEETQGQGETQTGNSSKRRALENVNAVVPNSQAPPSSAPNSRSAQAVHTKPTKPPSSSTQKQNTEAAKMDVDENFLKAVNSTKRGKKMEDAFDREFNNLKISRPELEKDEKEQEWALLADFGNESVRGNFMVILTLDVDRDRESRRSARVRSGNVEWAGRSDFKKFKKKAPGGRSRAVDLVVSEENDYGVGSSYWKPQTHPQPESQSFFGTASETAPRPKTQSRTQSSSKAKTRTIVVSDSDESDAKPTQRKAAGKKPISKTKSQSSAKRSTRSTRSREASQPLFLDSEDEGNKDASQKLDDIGEEEYIDIDEGLGPSDDEAMDDLDGMTSTMRTETESQLTAPRSSRRAGTQKRKAPVTDDDSDDVMFAGFKGKKRSRFG